MRRFHRWMPRSPLRVAERARCRQCGLELEIVTTQPRRIRLHQQNGAALEGDAIPACEGPRLRRRRLGSPPPSPEHGFRAAVAELDE